MQVCTGSKANSKSDITSKIFINYKERVMLIVSVLIDGSTISLVFVGS